MKHWNSLGFTAKGKADFLMFHNINIHEPNEGIFRETLIVKQRKQYLGSILPLVRIEPKTASREEQTQPQGYAVP